MIDGNNVQPGQPINHLFFACNLSYIHIIQKIVIHFCRPLSFSLYVVLPCSRLGIALNRRERKTAKRMNFAVKFITQTCFRHKHILWRVWMRSTLLLFWCVRAFKSTTNFHSHENEFCGEHAFRHYILSERNVRRNSNWRIKFHPPAIRTTLSLPLPYKKWCENWKIFGMCVHATFHFGSDLLTVISFRFHANNTYTFYKIDKNRKCEKALHALIYIYDVWCV